MSGGARTQGNFVVVDSDRCQQHGVCMFAAPQVFVDLNDEVGVVIEQDEEGRFGDEIAAAVRQCPTGALTVVTSRPL